VCKIRLIIIVNYSIKIRIKRFRDKTFKLKTRNFAYELRQPNSYPRKKRAQRK